MDDREIKMSTLSIDNRESRYSICFHRGFNRACRAHAEFRSTGYVSFFAFHSLTELRRICKPRDAVLCVFTHRDGKYFSTIGFEKLLNCAC